MLGYEGFVHHVSSIQHETNMYNTYKSQESLKSVENSKDVLLKSFIEQQEKIERYKKALKEIAEYGGIDMIGKTCSTVAEEALKEK